MNKKHSNPCTRCGRERIDSKTWKETVVNFIGTTIVTHTETVCPDPECQAIVEKELEKQRKKKEKFELDKENRKAQFKKLNKNRSQITISSRKSL